MHDSEKHQLPAAFQDEPYKPLKYEGAKWSDVMLELGRHVGRLVECHDVRPVGSNVGPSRGELGSAQRCVTAWHLKLSN